MIMGGLKAFYNRNRIILQLNKNMILSGIVGFFVSAIAAEEYYRYTQNDLILSVATVLTGFAVSNVVFAILFHIDSKYLYVDRSTGKINFQVLKQILKKLVAAGAVFEIVNTSSRFIILYLLFTIDLDPLDASMLSSVVASGLSYLSINLVLRRYGLFQTRNTANLYFKK
jgi:hypothetical protein